MPYKHANAEAVPATLEALAAEVNRLRRLVFILTDQEEALASVTQPVWENFLAERGFEPVESDSPEWSCGMLRVRVDCLSLTALETIAHGSETPTKLLAALLAMGETEAAMPGEFETRIRDRVNFNVDFATARRERYYIMDRVGGQAKKLPVVGRAYFDRRGFAVIKVADRGEVRVLRLGEARVLRPDDPTGSDANATIATPTRE